MATTIRIYEIPTYIRNTSPARLRTKAEWRYSQHQQGTPSSGSICKQSRAFCPRNGTKQGECPVLHLLSSVFTVWQSRSRAEKEHPSKIHLNVCSFSQAMSERILASKSLFTRESHDGMSLIAGGGILESQIIIFLSSLIPYYTNWPTSQGASGRWKEMMMIATVLLKICCLPWIELELRHSNKSG